MVLLGITALSVFKLWGRTAYGLRLLEERRAPGDREPVSGMPLGLKVALAIAGALVVGSRSWRSTSPAVVSTTATDPARATDWAPLSAECRSKELIMHFRSSIAGAACVVGAALAITSSGPTPRAVAQDHGRRQERGTPDDPGELFQQRCVSCHVAPDPGVATDRAWIRQLQETA